MKVENLYINDDDDDDVNDDLKLQHMFLLGQVCM